MGTFSWTEDYGEEMFGNFNMSTLGRDGAYLNVSNTLGSTVYLYSVFKKCYKCPYIKELPIYSNHTYYIDTTYHKLWRIMLHNPSMSSQSSSDHVFCQLEPQLGEFGVYSLEISSQGCNFQILKEPVNIYFPILTVLLIITSIIAVFKIIQHIYNFSDKNQKYTKQPNDSTRIQSLDTFRGLCMSAMILVNYGIGGYVVMDHEIWNGLQFADFIFPSFMWIMGVCIPISMSSGVGNSRNQRNSFKNILKRSCVLFLLGLLKYFIALRRLRIFGVLQRYSISYFVTASITAACSNRLSKSFVRKTRSTVFIDILATEYHWVVAITLTIAHTLVTMFAKVPNCPRGYLGPGGYHEDGQHRGCTAGINGYIDKILLGDHGYFFASTHKIYNSEAYEPTGVLGQVTSIILVITGIQAGSILIFHKTHSQRMLRWLLWGIPLALIGGALCSFSKEGGIIPINRHLWSISYVCTMSGFAFVAFTCCYYLVDVKRYWSGEPFIFAGMNSIILYMGQATAVALGIVPFRWVVNGKLINATHFLTLSENIWGLGVWLLIAYCLFKMKYFVSV